MKSAIIFGASGLVGGKVLELLLDHDAYYKIILCNRRNLNLSSPKLSQHEMDFDKTEEFSDKLHADIVFCCLGTTIKKARSIDNFVRIDHDIPLQLAQIAKTNGINRFVLVSSIGANADSKNYYLKTKGKLENDLMAIGFENLKIVKPSFLLGKRNEFRFFEEIGKVVFWLFGFLMIGKLKKYRPIKAVDVAKAMVHLAEDKTDKIIFESNDLIKIALE